MVKYFVSLLCVCLCACTPTSYYETPSTLTTGIVQREICIGMPASEVAEVLGSPNIVSLDEEREEVWVYDKVSTQIEYSTKGSGVWLLVVGAGSESGYAKRSQRTLTVIVKLDKQKQVKDFTYHSSSF